MKHLITLASLLVSTLSLAQQMPYNPDANGDDFVGVDDVLGVLGVYDTALMQPDLECDYEGTDLEQLCGGLIAGSLVLDSVYVEYFLVDSVTTYLPECPDPVVIETVLDRSFMLTTVQSELSLSNPEVQCNDYFLDYYRKVVLRYFPYSGKFHLALRDDEVDYFTTYNSWASWRVFFDNGSTDENVGLPFPTSWELSNNGIEVDWHPNGWVGDSQNFRLIPFWHEAE